MKNSLVLHKEKRIIQNINNTNNIKNFNRVEWNCNGIGNKLEELKQFLFSEKPDIICINEIKISEHKANSIFNFYDYDRIFKVR